MEIILINVKEVLETNETFVFFLKVSAELKEKSLQAKTRGDEAFKNKNYMAAVDAYTQVITQYIALNFQAYIAMINGEAKEWKDCWCQLLGKGAFS